MAANTGRVRLLPPVDAVNAAPSLILDDGPEIAGEKNLVYPTTSGRVVRFTQANQETRMRCKVKRGRSS